MASISRDAFYVNFVNFDRVETALILSLIIAALQCSKDELDEMGRNIGGIDGVQERLLKLGSKLDEDWPNMLEAAAKLCGE